MSFTIPYALSDGDHGIVATLADRAGNEASLDETLRVDTVLPSDATLVGVSSGAVFAGTVAMAATATDTLSGVKNIQILRNGVLALTLRARAEITSAVSS